jgi:hypothetical protein
MVKIILERFSNMNLAEMESFKDVVDFYMQSVEILKKNAQHIPTFIGFPYTQQKFFEVSAEYQRKIFTYIQDKKRGIQNKKIMINKEDQLESV